MEPIRVFLAEDNEDLAQVLGLLLEEYGDIRCVGFARSLRDLAPSVAKSGAQVVVLDVELAGETSVKQLPALRAALPGVEFVMFSGHDRPELAEAARAAGARAYVVKTNGAEALAPAIREAAGARR